MIIIVLFFLLYIIYLLFIYSMWDWVGTKDRFFHRGWGMGVEALIRKNTRVFLFFFEFFWGEGGELGIIISAGQNNWEVF